MDGKVHGRRPVSWIFFSLWQPEKEDPGAASSCNQNKEVYEMSAKMIHWEEVPRGPRVLGGVGGGVYF